MAQQHNNTDIILLKYSFILQPDGQLRTDVDNINPEEFIKAVKEVDPDWDGAGIVSQGLKYLLNEIKQLDIEFDKYLLTL